MKVAITSSGKSPDSEVDQRFGRASYFAIYDTENDTFSFADNAQNFNAANGAGIQSAQNVASAGAQVLITGNCGPKAFRTLSAAGIKVVIGATGTVKEAATKFKNGEMSYATDANVEGHW
ncbi:MAG TPA: NifB/NifX family molybdenum-iron cluster-binding protein [bacterium]|jgi:predicted Fe-Mo cluster-binding NifX family protein|nr:dinitrogenase iron-molybdenum cofactor biosynthesis protein [Myxococcales bacterium]OQA62143.1 MAG: Dinitrogenase iron-molybdenum cofactor [bacterium ADurb.Bin270]HPW45975.1 NifB/NifX family molybdenum-iron cluster-binding protein [bacterium]HQC50265.1 NifB/NifX family molybdenum-iron cluster-binding protein [bacterium]HQG13998.1 NifB/NifX family molybdenum-iron cluster-binding protein [bacterium]